MHRYVQHTGSGFSRQPLRQSEPKRHGSDVKHQQYGKTLEGCHNGIRTTNNPKNNVLQASGLSQRETNDLLDTYVREQVEEKGAGETHMWVHLRMGCRQLSSLCWLNMYLTVCPALRSVDGS